MYKHGFAPRNGKMHPFYARWADMRTRTTNPNFKQYKDYGGRGIKCLWLTFDDFKRDMYSSFQEHAANHGSSNTTLDRINNNGDYCKDNCRWATRQQQGQKSRRTLKITWNGRTQNLRQWAKELNVNYQSIQGRIHDYAWSVERAFTTPF